jgi:hypothetical protein
MVGGRHGPRKREKRPERGIMRCSADRVAVRRLLKEEAAAATHVRTPGTPPARRQSKALRKSGALVTTVTGLAPIASAPSSS